MESKGCRKVKKKGQDHQISLHLAGQNQQHDLLYLKPFELPKSEDLMNETETYRGVIYPWHCDFNDHMNVQHYIGRFDEATWHYLASIGISPSYLKTENRAMVAAEQNIKYFEELHAGDLIFVQTSLMELKSKTIIFLHKMINAETGHVVAEGRMVGVHIDKKTRSAIAFPEEVSKKISTL